MHRGPEAGRYRAGCGRPRKREEQEAEAEAKASPRAARSEADDDALEREREKGYWILIKAWRGRHRYDKAHKGPPTSRQVNRAREGEREREPSLARPPARHLVPPAVALDEKRATPPCSHLRTGLSRSGSSV